MEHIIEGAAIPLHDSRAAVNQRLHPIPLFPADDGFMTVFNELPFITGNLVDRIGTYRFLLAIIRWKDGRLKLWSVYPLST